MYRIEACSQWSWIGHDTPALANRSLRVNSVPVRTSNIVTNLLYIVRRRRVENGEKEVLKHLQLFATYRTHLNGDGRELLLQGLN